MINVHLCISTVVMRPKVRETTSDQTVVSMGQNDSAVDYNGVEGDAGKEIRTTLTLLNEWAPAGPVDSIRRSLRG